MSYVALYRKFRPSDFGDVKGQDHIVTTLKNQIEADRIGHAYLFCGTRGTGKTSVAKIFAKAVNCLAPVDNSPCCECDNCRAIAAGASMSVAEIDAASNTSVESVRQIIEEVSFPPVDGCKYKVYIIDEVHMLSVSAFNALLKTLEEPPSYCIFILATTDPQKVPVTILSRCQRYDFKRLSVDIIADRLEELTSLENINVEPRALRYIARLADGAMRDALSMLDQCIAFNFKDVLTYDNVLNVLGAVDMQVFGSLYEAVEKRDVLGCMRVLDEVIIQGRDLGQFVTDYTWYLRNLLILLTADGAEDIIDMSRENMERLKSQAEGADPASIMRYIRVFSELSNTIRYDAQKRIRIELALIKLCKPSMEKNDDSLLDRIRALEQRMDEAPVVNQGAVVIRSEAVAEEAPREVPAALPEDIKKIVHNWSSLVGEAMGMTRASLRNAYPSIDDSGRLMIVTHVKSEADYLKGEFGRKDMEELFFRHVAAKVDYVVELVPVDGSKDRVNPNLLKIEGVEILIETDSSEEDEEYV